jgi:hypothetical protein
MSGIPMVVGLTFHFWTQSEHSNTELVWCSDVHCITLTNIEFLTACETLARFCLGVIHKLNKRGVKVFA